MVNVTEVAVEVVVVDDGINIGSTVLVSGGRTIDDDDDGFVELTCLYMIIVMEQIKLHKSNRLII